MSKTHKDSETEMSDKIASISEFLQENNKMISYVGIGLLVVILGATYLKYKFLPDREAAAQSAIFHAQNYFQIDSFDIALNGSFDGDLGFIDIAKKFSFTKTANLSSYYAGLCNLYMGNYDDAITHLKKFDTDEPRLETLKLSAIGDAYMEKGDVSEGLSFYKKAVNEAEDEFTAPLMLLKTGKALEANGGAADALKMYQRIESEYPTSSEAKSIQAHIERAKAMI